MHCSSKYKHYILIRRLLRMALSSLCNVKSGTLYFVSDMIRKQFSVRNVFCSFKAGLSSIPIFLQSVPASSRCTTIVHESWLSIAYLLCDQQNSAFLTRYNGGLLLWCTKSKWPHLVYSIVHDYWYWTD